MSETKETQQLADSVEPAELTPEELEFFARKAGLCCDNGNWFSPAGAPEDEFDVSSDDLARFANLVFAHAVRLITSAAGRSAQG